MFCAGLFGVARTGAEGGGGTEVGVDLDQAVGFGHVGIRRQRGRCLPDWLAKKGSCD